MENYFTFPNFSVGLHVSNEFYKKSDYYTNKPMTVFFFNCFNESDDCKKNIEKLSSLFKSNGHQCFNMNNINSLNDIKNSINNMYKPIFGMIIIFFFGYGYGNDHIYLETSNESVSYMNFLLEMNKVRIQGNPIVLFSNISYKSPQNTLPYSHLPCTLKDVFHYSLIFTDGIENTSLLTNSFVDEIHNLQFTDFMYQINKRLNTQRNCCVDVKYYGVQKQLEFPNLQK